MAGSVAGLALALSALPAPASSQTPPAAVDPQQIVARARELQREFERLRRRHFPRAGTPGRRCHEIVGRFCVWHDPDDVWESPPEAPAVAEARAALIAALDSLGRLSPHDRWIHGQRTRYRVEAGRLAEAVELAADCPAAPPGWCTALLGYARFESGDFEGAEAAFARALSVMSAGERCRWNDLSWLLGRAGRAYRDLECGERAGWEDEFWWLADPLFLVPGNERRAAHYARHVMSGLQEDAASGYGVRWGEDLRELLLRYGWPAGWDLLWRRDPGLRTEAAVQSHDLPGARHFIPRPEWVGGVPPGTPAEWSLAPARPRTQFGAPYAAAFEPLEHQLAVFPRGDTAVVVAAYDLSRDTIPPCKSLEHGLFLAPGPRGPHAVARGAGADPRGAMRLGVVTSHPVVVEQLADSAPRRPPARHWLSLEALCPNGRWAARARYGVALAPDPGDGLSVSDVLLLESGPEEAPPGSLEEALPRALGFLGARPGDRLALYWELYDRSGWGRDVEVTVTLGREGKGFFRRVAEWTGLASRRADAVGLRWHERSDGAAWLPRSVALDLPDLAPGRYRISLHVAGSGFELETGRTLLVER